MKTSVERLDGTNVKLTVTLTPEDVDASIGRAYAKTASRVRIPGFRAGKAPRPIIDTYVGRESVLADALEDLVEDSYPLALDAEGLRPIGQPDVGTLDGLEPGAGYTFSAEVELRPELTLTSIDGLTVTVPPAASSDREIDAQIDYLRDRFATLEVVEDRGVSADDFAIISFVGTVDGEAYEGNEVDKYLYELGRGQMPVEFDAAMIGAKPGDTVRAEFPVPDTSSNPEFVGKVAGFDITVHEIKAKNLPVVDDEFAANVGGFDTAQELRDDIRAKLDENKAAAHIRLVERGAREMLAARLVGDVPKAMIDTQANEMLRDFLEGLEHRDVTIEQYLAETGVTADELRADVAREAEVRVREELALEALARAAGLAVTDEEVETEIGLIAASQETGPEALRARLKSNGAMPLIVEGLTHRSAVRWLMDNVEIIEEGAEGASDKKPAKKAAKSTSAKKAASTATEKGE